MTVVACLTASPAAAAPCPNMDVPAGQASYQELRESLLCLVNRERRREKADGVQPSPRLEFAALRHSQDMRTNGFFAHDSLDGRTFVDRVKAAGYLDGHENERWALGETLAWGVEASSQPLTIVKALMDSPTHRGVIVDERYRDVGIGVTRGTPAGDADGVTVTLDFGFVGTAAGDGVSVAGESAGPGKKPSKGRKKPRKPKGKASSATAVSTSSTRAAAADEEPPLPAPVAEDDPGPGKGHDKEDKGKGRD